MKNQNEKSSKWSLLGMILIICFLLATCGSSGTSSTHTATCRSCGRTWEAGDPGKNFMSIARTNLCKNCYNNYKWSQDALSGLGH